jgi:hypothetical protein
MKRLLTAALLLGLSACGDDPPAAKSDAGARTNDLSAGPAPTAAMPSAQEVESACSRAAWQAIAEDERRGIVDPSFEEYPVRNPVCRPEPGAAAAMICRFDQATIFIEMPTPEQRRESLKRMKAQDWKPFEARLVRVGSARSEWVAPSGCQPVRSGAS